MLAWTYVDEIEDSTIAKIKKKTKKAIPGVSRVAISIQIDEFCIKIDEFCIKAMSFVFKMMMFALEMMSFVFKTMSFAFKLIDSVFKMMIFIQTDRHPAGH